LQLLSDIFNRFAINRNCSLIVNSRFLRRPQKRSRGNQLIHRRLTNLIPLETFFL